LAVGVAVLLVLTSAGKEKWVLLGLVVAVVAVTLPTVPASEQSQFQSRFDQLFQPQAETGRKLIYREAFKTIGQYPLTGVGPLTLKVIARRDGTVPGVEADLTHAHNVFLEGFLSLGPLGIAGFVWLFAGAAKRFVSVYRRSRRDPWLAGYAAGALAALASFLVQGMVDFIFWQVEVLVVLFVLLGSAYALEKISLHAGHEVNA
jgi:O-antigen ligase